MTPLVALLMTAYAGLASAAMAPGPAPMSSAPSGPFAVPPLRYDYGALEPAIDMKTMQLHHDKHHKAYVDNLNTALATPLGLGLSSLSLTQMLRAVNTSALPPSLATLVRNNGGGHSNHIFFWRIMTPASNSSGPMGELAPMIDSSFGNFTAFKMAYTTAATKIFGSGWAWLIMTPDNKLKIITTANQDSPLMTGLSQESGYPILGIDVWEHAYYLRYQNLRPKYIENWWTVVNWQQAEDNFQAAKRGDTLLEPQSV